MKLSRKKSVCVVLGVIAVIAFVFMSRKQESYDAFALARNGTPKEIQKAIDSGIDLEALNASGETVLITAALYNTDPEAVRVLLRAGANKSRSSSRNSYGNALFHAAQLNSNPEVMRTLLDAEDISTRALILDGTIRFGYTLLGWAVTMNTSNPQVARSLLQAGADVNAKNDDGRTALICSSMMAYNPGMLKLLVDAGADVNIRDNDGKTALMYAQHEPSAMSGVLLKAGANANIQDNDGKTALMYSAQRGHGSIKSLLNHGADKNIRDHSGKTAYDYALSNKDFDAELLPLLKPDE